MRAGALAMDKWATKLVAEAMGIATAPGSPGDDAADAVAWDGPVVVKPVAAGSSHGVSLVRTADELAPALAQALALDDRVLVEELVVGREIDVAVLRRAGRRRCSSDPPWRSWSTSSSTPRASTTAAPTSGCPAALDDVQRKELEDAALTMYEALGCAGVARIDFFVTDDGLVLNEVNTMPGMTEQSQVPKMFAAVGLPLPDLLDELVPGALAS